MTDNCAGDGASLCNDEELGHVDHASAETGLVLGGVRLQRLGIGGWDKTKMYKITTLTSKISIHWSVGTSFHTGHESARGMTYKSMKAASGAWLRSSCILFTFIFLWNVEIQTVYRELAKMPMMAKMRPSVLVVLTDTSLNGRES